MSESGTAGAMARALQGGRLEGLAISGTMRFSAMASQRKAAGQRIISLGLGEPSIPTPPHIVEAAYDAMKKGFTRYSLPGGIPELRAAIAEKLARENGLAYAPEEIVVTPGAKNALHVALSTLLRPGDEVVNILPSFVSYDPLIAIAGPGVTVRYARLTEPDHRLDLASLEAAFTPRTRLLLYNSPHNPTGRVFDETEIRGLCELCRRHGCFIVSDEIYERLIYTGRRHLSPAAVEEMRDLTVVVNGFSKAYAMTGWRIGYLAAPRELVKQFEKFQSHVNTNTCTFVQKAAVAALQGPQDHLDAYRELLGKNREALMRAMKSQSSLECPAPEGGLFAMASLRATGLDSEEFCVRLLEATGVGTTPGGVFGAEGFVRISLASSLEETREGIELLMSFARGLSA